MGLKIKGLLFDKDGTLFDFHASWGPWLAGFIAELTHGKPHQARLAEALGFDLSTQRFLPASVFVHDTLEEILDVMLPHIPDWNRADMKEFAILETEKVPQTPIVPLVDLLEKFRLGGLVLGVATNDNEAPAIAQLKTAGIAQLFDFIAGYDSGFGGKPATGMQIAFCTKLGLDAKSVAMVGDSLHDMVSGRDAGMMTIGVLTGTTARADLEGVADVVLEDISDIPAYLAQL